MKCVCTSPPLISPALYGYAALLAGTLCAYSSALLETDIRYGQLSTLQQTTLLNSNQAPLVCAHSSSALLNNRYQISDMGSSAHCNKHKEQFISVRTQQQLGTAARHSSALLNRNRHQQAVRIVCIQNEPTHTALIVKQGTFSTGANTCVEPTAFTALSIRSQEPRSGLLAGARRSAQEQLTV